MSSSSYRRVYYRYRHHSQWLNNTDLQAQYCVKMTGVFEGKMGTKRSPESFYLINMKIMAPKGHQNHTSPLKMKMPSLPSRWMLNSENHFHSLSLFLKRVFILSNPTGSAVQGTGAVTVSTSSDQGTFRWIFRIIYEMIMADGVMVIILEEIRPHIQAHNIFIYPCLSSFGSVVMSQK